MKQNNNLDQNIYIRTLSAVFIFFILWSLLYIGGNVFKACVVFLTCSMIFEVVRLKKRKPFFFTIGLKTSFIVYIICSMGMLLSLYDEYDYNYILFIAALVCLNDTGAFFIGSFFKGPKLFSAISPHKTWSGLIGGIFCGMVGCLIILKIANVPFYFSFSQLLFLCLVSHIGDLVESLFKRQMHVKDMGHMIPGHGGVLDRFDSVLLVNYVMYWLVR